MINLVVLGKTEDKAKFAADWIVSGDVVGDKYEHKFELPGKASVITAHPFWIGNPNPHPVVDGVLVYCKDASDLADLDSLVHFYLAVPVKFIVYDGVPEQKAMEAKWTAKGLAKKMPVELVEKLINAHNDLVKLIGKVFNEFDKDHSNFIEIGEIKAVAKELGVDIPESEAKVLMTELDKNKDGKISLLEFTEWWKNGRKAKSGSLSDVIMRKIKKSPSLSMAADILTQYGGIEELKGEEAKLVSSSFSFHINKVASPGFLINIAGFSKGKSLDNAYQTYANAISLPPNEPFVGISFGCKNPKAVEEKLKTLIESGMAMAGGISPQVSMVQSMMDIKYGVTSGKAVIAVSAAGAAKAMIEPLLGKLKLNPAYSIPDQVGDVYISFATDFQKLVTEDKPFYELLLKGFSVEYKSHTLESSMNTLSKALEAQKAQLHMLPHEVRQILSAVFSSFKWYKCFRGELEFEVGNEIINAISEKVEGTPVKMPLKDLKMMVVPMIKPIIEGMPLLSEIHSMFKDEITNFEIFLRLGDFFGLRIYFDLPGLGEFLKLD